MSSSPAEPVTVTLSPEEQVRWEAFRKRERLRQVAMEMRQKRLEELCQLQEQREQEQEVPAPPPPSDADDEEVQPEEKPEPRPSTRFPIKAFRIIERQKRVSERRAQHAATFKQ